MKFMQVLLAIVAALLQLLYLGIVAYLIYYVVNNVLPLFL